jgi:hypothetical protein
MRAEDISRRVEQALSYGDHISVRDQEIGYRGKMPSTHGG